VVPDAAMKAVRFGNARGGRLAIALRAMGVGALVLATCAAAHGGEASVAGRAAGEAAKLEPTAESRTEAELSAGPPPQAWQQLPQESQGLPVGQVPVAPSVAKDAHPYVLGMGDVVKLSVWNEPQLTVQTEVSAEGTVMFPLIGAVKAAGLTVSELEEVVAQEYSDGYLVDPHVIVRIVQRRSRNVYVLGAAKRPGVYPLRDNATLLELLAECGGCAENGSNTIVIVRSNPAEDEAKGPGVVGDSVHQKDAGERDKTTDRRLTQRIQVDRLRLLSGDLTANVALRERDIILFPPAQQTGQEVYVLGDVATRGAFPLQEALTLMRLVASLGLNPEDENTKVTVLRFNSGAMQRKTFGVKQILHGGEGADFDLRDGDILNIEQPRETYYVIGQVGAPGAFRYRKGLTVREAIIMAGWITPRGNLKKINVMRKTGAQWINVPVQLQDDVLPGDVIKVEERWF